MTKDVIELAREAGLVPASLPVGMREWKKTALAKFADLVAAQERERVAAWIEPQRNDVPATGYEFALAIRALNTEGEGNDRQPASN